LDHPSIIEASPAGSAEMLNGDTEGDRESTATKWTFGESESQMDLWGPTHTRHGAGKLSALFLRAFELWVAHKEMFLPEQPAYY